MIVTSNVPNGESRLIHHTLLLNISKTRSKLALFSTHSFPKFFPPFRFFEIFHFSEPQRLEAVLRVKAGESTESVAESFDCTRRTIQRWVKQWSTQHALTTRKRSGRPSAWTPRKKARLGRIFLANRTTPSKKLQPEIEERTRVPISASYVRRLRNELGWRAVRPLRRPFLTPHNRLRRLAFAQYEVHRDWSRVLFTDESKIELFRNTKLVFKQEREPRPIFPAPLKRISLFVWGGIASKGKTELVFLNDLMKDAGTGFTSELYVRVLKDHCLPDTLRLFGDEEWRLQQDNSPIHTAKKTKKFLDEKKVFSMN